MSDPNPERFTEAELIGPHETGPESREAITRRLVRDWRRLRALIVDAFPPGLYVAPTPGFSDPPGVERLIAEAEAIRKERG